ncbi:MAG: flavodoxin family protein [Candidatus Thorarchaeota archaeon]
MKVVLFNGSPREKGNTYHCLNVVIEEIRAAGIECEIIWMGLENLRGCRACYKCAISKMPECAQKEDKLNEYLHKMLDADGIILGSPTYFSNMTAPMKALVDRAGLISKLRGNLLKGKVGASVVAVRRAGANHVFSSLNFFFLIAEMIVVGSSYWNLGIGREPGDVLKDVEGIQTFKNLGRNFAFVLQKLKS